MQTVGLIFLALAVLIAVNNFYLSVLRVPLLWLLRLPYDKHVSGLPVIGNIFLLLALVFLQSSMAALWATAAVLIVIDTGGFPWFCFVMAREAWRSR